MAEKEFDLGDFVQLSHHQWKNNYYYLSNALL
jgi:hypothetical protein